ncbi:MAG: hypothetical protein IIA67_11215 [Planctomycetes bacterium]|nr:hypothetical protein [Planctomycetota bacterium]
MAVSRGIVSQDRRELRVWGPSHDSLLTAGNEPSSVNFFRLPSGAYCVSKTVAAGPEYSGRGGERIYTHYLVVPPEVLARFGNNPFAVLYAAVAGGYMVVSRQVPTRLGQIRLIGGAGQIDCAALSKINRVGQAACCGHVVDAVLAARSVAVVADRGPRKILSAAINCLPPSWRSDVSFSTGLKHSTRRPFRVIAVENDESLHQSLSRRHGFTIVGALDGSSENRQPLGGWAAFVTAALEANQPTAIADTLLQAGAAQTARELNRLGETARQAIAIKPRPLVASRVSKTHAP